MIMTTSLTTVASLLTWSTLGYALLTIGVIATLLSPYRYLLGYLLAGMIYWLVVDGIQSALSYLFVIDGWQSYIYALAFTWMLLGIWFIYRLTKHTRTAIQTTHMHGIKINTKARRKSISAKDRYGDSYIEHTPVYTDYQPRFHNNNRFNRFNAN